MSLIPAIAVDARPLAVTRILVGSAAVVIALEVRSIIDRIVAGAAPVPYLLPELDVSQMVLDLWTVITLLAAVLLVLGLFTRAAAALVSASFLAMLLWEQQVYSNHLTLLVLLSCYLAFGRAGGAWSLDARRFGRVPTPYWPQLLVMTQVSAVYLYAGLSKINATYLGGDVLADHLTVAVPAAVLPWVAAASVVTEVGLAVALWVPRVRVLGVVVGAVLHVSITLLVGNPFVLGAFSQLAVSAYPLFLTRPTMAIRQLRGATLQT